MSQYVLAIHECCISIDISQSIDLGSFQTTINTCTLHDSSVLLHVQRYIKGKSNSVADYLSRYSIDMATSAVLELSNQPQLVEHCSRKKNGERDSAAADLLQRKQGEKVDWNIVYPRLCLCADRSADGDHG